MKNRIYLILCFVLSFAPTLLHCQEDKSQELVELLNRGEFFKSKELYQQICDSINPDRDLFYKFRMAQFMHKEDSAAIYQEKMFADYPSMFGNNTIDAHAILFDTYISLRNYEKGVYTYERMKRHLQENPYNIDENILILWKNGTEQRLSYLKQLISQPPIKLKRKEIKDFAKIEGSDRLVLDAKINGVTQKTLFDTGCNFYYIMNRYGAKSLGIKCDISDMTRGVVNNSEVLIKQITIDSLEVGNITLYNIPGTIFENDITQYVPDSVKNNPERLTHVDSTYINSTNSIIGLPIMQLIGKFLIDYDNGKVIFPNFDLNPHSAKEPNLFLYNAYLYTSCKLNGKDFVGTLDTGIDSYIRVDTVFYEKHQNDMPIDTIFTQEPYYIMMANRLWNNLPYKIVHNPEITFNGKKIQLPTELTEEPVTIFSLRPIWPAEYFDGVIGYGFFKRIGKKVLLDLDNMRLEAIN